MLCFLVQMHLYDVISGYLYCMHQVDLFPDAPEVSDHEEENRVKKDREQLDASGRELRSPAANGRPSKGKGWPRTSDSGMYLCYCFTQSFNNCFYIRLLCLYPRSETFCECNMIYVDPGRSWSQGWSHSRVCESLQLSSEN